MKQISILLYFSWALVTGAFAQKQPSFTLTKSIPHSGVDFTVDNLNNLYLLTGTDQLKKYNSHGDSVAVFNDVRRFGKLHSLDVTNPLKLLLFYKDFSTIVILDRLLAVRTSIDLRRKNILGASAIGLAYDNTIWMYDAIENKLKKINEEGETLFQTADFRMLFSEPVLPQKIIDQNGKVYLFDEKEGLFVFDQYGTFQKKLALPGWKDVVILNEYVAGVHNNSIQLLNINTYKQQQYQFPSSFGSFSKYLIANTTLFGLSKDSISLFSFRF